MQFKYILKRAHLFFFFYVLFVESCTYKGLACVGFPLMVHLIYHESKLPFKDCEACEIVSAIFNYPGDIPIPLYLDKVLSLDRVYRINVRAAEFKQITVLPMFTLF